MQIRSAICLLYTKHKKTGNRRRFRHPRHLGQPGKKMLRSLIAAYRKKAVTVLPYAEFRDNALCEHAAHTKH